MSEPSELSPTQRWVALLDVLKYVAVLSIGFFAADTYDNFILDKPGSSIGLSITIVTVLSVVAYNTYVDYKRRQVAVAAINLIAAFATGASTEDAED